MLTFVVFVGYGLFAAAVVHAWLMQRAERQIRLASDNPVGLPLLTLERLLFRLIAAAFVFLTLTLATGKLERIVSTLRAIRHVEIIRIGSRVPVSLPMRATCAPWSRRSTPTKRAR